VEDPKAIGFRRISIEDSNRVREVTDKRQSHQERFPGQ
jgi:hypothetical protein